jgi:hypothetical protein
LAQCAIKIAQWKSDESELIKKIYIAYNCLNTKRCTIFFVPWQELLTQSQYRFSKASVAESLLSFIKNQRGKKKDYCELSGEAVEIYLLKLRPASSLKLAVFFHIVKCRKLI